MKHVLQWHITHKCNLRCTHCYQNEYSSDITWVQMENIFYQYLDFIRHFNYTGHINFTGGEPFVNEHLWDLLDLCEKNNISFGILTNGVLLTKDMVSRLAQYKYLSFVQISVDGTKQMHDKIRGKGTFDKTFKAVKLLKKAKIQVMAAFTCHKQNYMELSKVIRLVRRHRVDRFWVDRFIPIDKDKDFDMSMMLSTQEYRLVIKLLTKERQRMSKTVIHTNRALQFSEGCGEIYQCSAGNTLLTVLADGTLLPCRRLPIPIGNVLEKKMLDIYNKSELIDDLNKKEIPKECNQCYHASFCRGGAKCLSYALHGDYHIIDDNCYIHSKFAL